MKSPLFLNFPITKVDEEERVVYGVATSEAVDSQGDVIDYEASKKAFEAWKGNIREMHQPVAVGKAIDIQFDDEAKSVTIGAKISESADGENAWLKVREGVLTGFSIGGAVFETKLETAKVGDKEKSVRRILDYALSETSLVDNPANPEAVFSMVKSVGGGRLQRVEEVTTVKHKAPAWMHQFMLPIEKAQALYDESRMKDSKVKIEKTGAAVVDGDPRDTAGNTVSEDTPAAPKKGGSTVTRPMYQKDGSKHDTTKAQRAKLIKSVSDASWLAGIAQSLVFYIQSEASEDENVDDLKAALTTINAAVAQEIQEGDDFDVESAPDLLDYVYYAQQVIDLSKKGSDVKKADEAEETKVEDAPAAPAEGEDKTEPEVPTEGAPAEGAEDKPAEGEDEGKAPEAPAEGEEKAASIGDLKKFTEELFTKLGDHNQDQLKKALGEFTDKVEKSLTDLAGRVSKLEQQPAPSKGKASYMTVEKGDEGSGEAPEFTQAEVDEMVKLRDELAKDPTKGTMDERLELTKKLRKANRLGLLNK
jgi:phage head maturation protease